MLLKAGLVDKKQKVMDAKNGKSIGFEKCVNLGRTHLALTDEECGVLRAIDALRDDEQHWLTKISEGMLYLHCRAGTTLFDELLQRMFGESLSQFIPHRVLPLSSEIPRDIQILLDEDFTQIGQLLQPGKRKRTEARAQIRGLLAIEAHVRDDAQVSKKDVDRVERAIRRNATRDQVFPLLSTIGIDQTGEGVEVKVTFVKRGGAPVHFVVGDEAVDAGAVREVDLQRKYHWSKKELSDKLGLTTSRCIALRWRLGIDDDLDCHHDFTFGKTTFRNYSDNAFTRMRDALADGLDMSEVYEKYSKSNRGKISFQQE
jgi:hypothetical protein